MQTSVEKLANSFRDWQVDWDRYDKEHTNKPKSFDEFIQPFVEMHKQEIIDAYKEGHYHLEYDMFNPENWYNQTFKKD
jgi:hypothetical protein